jgi:tetratricopeptide (TPR) repeat protein
MTDFEKDWINNGAESLRLGNYEDSLNCFEKALKINPKAYEAWIYKGIVFDDLKDYKKAINCYNKALMNSQICG